MTKGRARNGYGRSFATQEVWGERPPVIEKPLHGYRAAAFLGNGCEAYFASIAWQAVMAIIL